MIISAYLRLMGLLLFIPIAVIIAFVAILEKAEHDRNKCKTTSSNVSGSDDP